MTKYLLMLFTALSVCVNASAVSSDSYGDDEEKVFIVSMTEFKNEVEITIVNAQGEEVYNSSYNNERYTSKAFDVKALPTGNYTLSVKDELREKVAPFIITKDVVEYDVENTTVIFKPTIQQIGEKVHINAIMKNASDVSVVVSNDRNEDVYTATYEGNTSFGKVLNLSELPNGFYTVKLSMNDELYTQKVTIR